ncbi:cytochrome c [Paraburkholderia sp. SARCC-3016]|uniref:c-type cytochrome n=1 Tax=Paraburkholderia sp. SARCC-3016 TaxID=3058611 RepID=UPI002808692E|nr:cytochrome c [Paraburkholderia sp. SARCC-3016]MDQ7976006.1 cytochrome c [Paraburkholderia sp. SARCC-3016]
MRTIFCNVIVPMLLAAIASSSMAADIAAGKSRAAQCAACHGPDGHAVMPQTPNLAGQDEDYLVAQLKAFRSGERQNETMSVIAKPLSDVEIANLAAYFHSLK